MKSMSEEEKIRAQGLMLRSKFGSRLSLEEIKFCESMYMLYPEEYSKLDEENREETMRRMNPLYRTEDK